MTTVTRNQKIYFAAVGLLALWVGIWGYFIPEHVNKAIPWLVPPFHARFLGAIYFSGVILMGGSLFARRFAEVRAAIVIVTAWTGLLLIISLFHLSEFDFSRGPVWFWFVAYILYPLIGLWITWTHPNFSEQSTGPGLPVWTQRYFFIQGLVTSILSLALLFLPGIMESIWPWKITSMLAQIYSGPFLAYGIGSFMLSRQQSWLEVRIVALASFILTMGVLIASVIHRALFTAFSMSMWLWFGTFLLAAVFLGAILLRNSNAEVSK
jgi:hypothetical protein